MVDGETVEEMTVPPTGEFFCTHTVNHASVWAIIIFVEHPHMSKWFAQGNASSDSEDDGSEKVKVDKEKNKIRNMAR